MHNLMLPLHYFTLIEQSHTQTSQMASTPVVKHLSECFIRPKYEVEEAKNPLYLAPGDLILLSGHYIQRGLLFIKPSPSIKEPEPMKILLDKLKHSLSLALVHFYPLAGQLEAEIDEDLGTSLIFINWNKGPGARFLHATIDMEVAEILSSRYVPRVVESFFDPDAAANHTGPLLSVQVTELVDCVFIGCSMNHVCGDGTSYWNFFNTWSEIFKANGDNITISKPPIHERWFPDGVGPIIKLPFIYRDETVDTFKEPNLRERIFHFSAESISKLKAKANQEYGGTKSISSFQALSAFAWRCITRGRRFPDDLETRCKLATNSRGRVKPPLPNTYFGNAVQQVRGECRVGELLSRNLGWAASLLHQAVEGLTEEKVHDMIKGWMKSPFVLKAGSFTDPQSVHIGSSPRFDMYGAEFGMAKASAVLSGYANKFDGKITCLPGRDGGGSVDLEICLSPDSMCALESDEEFMEVVVSGSC